MRKREGEKRTNWLLIKHRDEFAREGKKNKLLDEDISVASGRSMDEITAAKVGLRSHSSWRRRPERLQKPNGNHIALPRAHLRRRNGLAR